MSDKSTEIATHQLTPAFHQVHKTGATESRFGLDNTAELVGGGFGLYSSAGLKPKIGPIKSEFFRVGFGLTGSVRLDCGLENLHFEAGDMVFTFPGQVFSMRDRSADFSAYYILFSEAFLADSISGRDLREQFPFFDYAGAQNLHLDSAEKIEVEQLILKINDEIHDRRPDLRQAIQLYLQLLLMSAKRSYLRQFPSDGERATGEVSIVRRFKKLVGEHFISKRGVAEYAALLHISPDHLTKTLRAQTGKTAHQFIEEMLLLESKALLLHTEFSVAEIAWRLDFTDPSHFNKFFKKGAAATPLQFREAAKQAH